MDLLGGGGGDPVLLYDVCVARAGQLTFRSSCTEYQGIVAEMPTTAAVFHSLWFGVRLVASILHHHLLDLCGTERMCGYQIILQLPIAPFVTFTVYFLLLWDILKVFGRHCKRWKIKGMEKIKLG